MGRGWTGGSQGLQVLPFLAQQADDEIEQLGLVHLLVATLAGRAGRRAAVDRRTPLLAPAFHLRSVHGTAAMIADQNAGQAVPGPLSHLAIRNLGQSALALVEQLAVKDRLAVFGVSVLDQELLGPLAVQVQG